RKCRTECQTADFPRKLVAVAAWDRTEYGTASAPLRGTGGALTRTACAFLAPWLAASACYFSALLRFVVTLAQRCALGDDRFKKNSFVRLDSEYGFVQFNFADGSACLIKYGYFWH